VACFAAVVLETFAAGFSWATGAAATPTTDIADSAPMRIAVESVLRITILLIVLRGANMMCAFLPI
jgi:hypothetical protein